MNYLIRRRWPHQSVPASAKVDIRPAEIHAVDPLPHFLSALFSTDISSITWLTINDARVSLDGPSDKQEDIFKVCLSQNITKC